MEKRKHSRVPFHGEATAHTVDGTVSGTIDNLSMKGMLLITERKLPKNELMDIAIRLSGSEISIHLKGKAIRHTDAGTAIEFREIDLDSFTHLKNVVSYNSEDADIVEYEYYKSLGPA